MILFIALTLYALMVMLLLSGWQRLLSGRANPLGELLTQTAEVTAEHPTKFPADYATVSIVICCKNEAAHLSVLISALRAQSMNNFEVVWVNDHSDDSTPALMEASRTHLPNVIVIHAQGFGKKTAQQEGIMAATGSLIITTDADCIPPPGWVEALLRFHQKEQADLVIGPVRMRSENSWFGQLQQLEFATLVGSGMGAAAIQHPIFCNAANMAFRKSIWLKHRGALHPEEISGDDVFLLLAAKRSGDRIVVLASEAAMVTTAAQPTLRKFIQQRRRWASKTAAYSDLDIIATGVIVAAVNILFVSYGIVGLFNNAVWETLLSAVFLKFIVDLVFLSVIAPFFQLRKFLPYSALLSLIYPIYIVGIGASNFIRKKKDW